MSVYWKGEWEAAGVSNGKQRCLPRIIPTQRNSRPEPVTTRFFAPGIAY